MDLIQTAETIVWIIGALAPFAIAIFMLRRKLYRDFPVFFMYIAIHAVQGVVGFFLIRFSQSKYFWFYWGFEGLDAFLTLAVIQEMFSVIFAPYEALQKLGVVVFRWLAVVLCIFAIVTAIASPSGEINSTMNALFILDRSVQVLQLGLVFFLFVFCRVFGMTWRHYVFGIAAGLLTMCTIGMIALAIRTHKGQVGNSWFDLVAPIGYTLGTLTWVYYFSSEKSVVPLNIVPRTDQLIAWNQALSKVGQR